MWNATIPAMPKLSAPARARKMRLLLFDVGGVLTDGKLFFLPEKPQQMEFRESAEPTAQSQVEFKGFHAHDGASISLARLGGIKTGLITKRSSDTVALRASDLKLEYVYQGVDDKGACFDQIVQKAGLN